VSAVKRVEFVSDSLSYILLRGRCCNIIVLNVHAPSEEISDDSKDRFCEDLSKSPIIFLSRFHPFLQATKALRETRGIALLCFLDLGTTRG
jgi:hypothetical protein